MALVTGEAHLELKVSPEWLEAYVGIQRKDGKVTAPYWNLLLPYEQRGPSRLRIIKRALWKQRHNRIFALERALDFHACRHEDVLPWCAERGDPSFY